MKLFRRSRICKDCSKGLDWTGCFFERCKKCRNKNKLLGNKNGE